MTNNKAICCSAPCLEIHNKQKRAEYAQKNFVINDKSLRLESAIDRVVKNAWEKGDASERAIIEFQNPKLKFR